MGLKNSTWKSSHFKAVLQLAADSMLKVSLPYYGRLSYGNFHWFQILFFFIYGAFYLNKFAENAENVFYST